MINAIKILLLMIIVVYGNGQRVNTPEDWSNRARYQNQDPISGAYQYGYSAPQHTKSESSFDGVTRGGYSYIDPNGIRQKISYTADAEHGFRVRGINLPETEHAKATVEQSLPTLLKFMKRLRPIENNSVPESSSSLSEQNNFERPHNNNNNNNQNYKILRKPAIIAPTNQIIVEEPPPPPPPVAGPPALIAMPIITMPARLIHGTSRHYQDSFGQYDYSYSGDTSAKQESRSMDGTVRGAYSYIDPNGILQQVHYIADHGGFRILATSLPQSRR